MRSIVCTRPGLMEHDDRETPVCGAGEALLRIQRIGICGTDIHALGGNQPYFAYARVLGHKLAQGELAVIVGASPIGMGVAQFASATGDLERRRAGRRSLRCYRRYQGNDPLDR